MSDEKNTHYSVEAPEFKEWSLSRFYDYANSSADFEDLNMLNAQIVAAKVALFKIVDKINVAERRALTRKREYERTLNRKIMESSEKTASDRRISAEIQTEDLENKYLYYEQLAVEFKRAYNVLKEELSALEVQGNNMRQQIKIAQGS